MFIGDNGVNFANNYYNKGIQEMGLLDLRICGLIITLLFLILKTGGLRLLWRDTKVSSSWKLKLVKHHSKKWNRGIFGDVGMEKESILRRIEEIDYLESLNGISEKLWREICDLRNKYECVLVKEVQVGDKTKIKWIKVDVLEYLYSA